MGRWCDGRLGVRRCIRSDCDGLIVSTSHLPARYPVQQKQGFCDSCVMLLVKAGEYGLPWDGRHGYGWIRGFFRRDEDEGWLWVVLIENGDVNIKVCCNCVHDRRARPFGRVCGVFVQRCRVHPSVLVDVFRARAVREYGAELFVFPPEAWWVKRD